jgi:hypothetical protein
MNWQIYLLTKAAVSLTLTLDLLVINILPTLSLNTKKQPEVNVNINQVAQYIPPRGMSAPSSTAGGGTRGNSCGNTQETSRLPLTALVPNVPENSNWAVTVAASPKFFVYVPKSSARKAEFVLKDEDQNDVYRTSFAISGQAEIIEIRLPEKTSLPIDKPYSWYFTLFCNPIDRSQNAFTNSATLRIKINSALEAQINQSKPIERYKLYAQNGIWHEAVATLAEERRKNPDDATLAAEWKKLLESAGIKDVVDAPFILVKLEDTK